MHIPADTDCWVLVDGAWHPGIIAEWRRDEAGAWTAWVRWVDGEGGRRVDVVAGERVRARAD